jgi:hypothetical protein
MVCDTVRAGPGGAYGTRSPYRDAETGAVPLKYPSPQWHPSHIPSHLASAAVSSHIVRVPADAIAFARRSIAADLRAARAHAGLTCLELALKVGHSVQCVSEAESGSTSQSPGYVAAVLSACGLPKDWRPA